MGNQVVRRTASQWEPGRSGAAVPAVGRSATPLRQMVWIGTVLVLLVEGAAMMHGADAGWDTRNYHLYNPFALFNKPAGVDIAPAHMQTWFPPTLDILYYVLVRTIGSTVVLNAVAAIPHAVAVALSYVLTCRLMQARSGPELVYAGIAVIIGATGAAAAPTIATASSEMLPASLVLLALLVLIPADLTSPPSVRQVFIAGLLAGGACGLKLTYSYIAICLAVTLVFVPRRVWYSPGSNLVALGIGGFLGTALFTGYWWVIEWRQFGNPFFPMYNQVFHSPAAASIGYIDDHFQPTSWREALQAPWAWALSMTRMVSESRMRDPRMALAIPAAVACLIMAYVRHRTTVRRSWPVPFIALWFLLCFAFWRLGFSIYRYLSVLELLTGPLMALALLPLARWLDRVAAAAAGLAVLLALLAYITVYPLLARSPLGSGPLEVTMPVLPGGSLVLLLDSAPMAYLALFQPPGVRFVGTSDSFMTTDSFNPMHRLVVQAIAEQTGEIWGLDVPADLGGMSETSLRAYGLVRGACQQIRSQLDQDRVRLCRLSKG